MHERYGFTNYYTAPTLVRSLMGAFPDGAPAGKYDLSSVRLLRSVGDTDILGRIDDVINISDHRLSTIEIESALVSHETVVEAGVCPVENKLIGHQAVAFVTVYETGQNLSEPELKQVLTEHVRQFIGSIAKPKNMLGCG